VVTPLEPVPRSATLAVRGRPPGPRIASRAGNPVDTTGLPNEGPGSGRSSVISLGSGAVASAPTTSPTSGSPGTRLAVRGAAAPQRDWRVARAAATSGESVAMRRGLSNKCSI
jgi:hypothetical protein